jgi:hypothetical protein
MSFMDVMYGPLGQVNNQFQNNLANNAAGMNYSNNLVNSWQNVPQVDMNAWSQATNANAKAISDAYIASNLAIGGGWGQNGQNVWATGAPAYQDYGGGANPGGFSPSPNYPGGGGGGWTMGADGQSRYVEPSYGGYGGDSYGYMTPQTGLPGNQSPSNYFDTLTMGAGYNPYTGPAAGYNPYDAASFGLGQNWQAPNNPNSMALLGYDPNASAQWAPGQSWAAPVMNGGGDFWSNYNAASAAAAAGYRDPGNIDRYRGGEAYGQPSANPSYFDPGTYYGPGGGGGYDPWRSAALPAYDPNSFANRFAAGGYYNPGTPSQYTTETYRDVGGIAYPGGMAPTGYQGLYGMEDPTGALPLGWSPVDNQGQKHFFGG